MNERFDRWAASWENQPWIAIVVLTIPYLAMVLFPIQRHLWYDELYTYYIAAEPDLRHLFEALRKVDLNPPLVYLVTRAWQSLFGTGETLSRVPSAIAFFFASFGFYTFLKSRAGSLWAAAAVLLFWCTPYFQYATELRPYALLLACFSLTLNSWDRATTESPRKLALLGIGLGGTGMMLCHVVAGLSLGAIYLGELLRQWRTRRVDWVICIFLLLPLCVIPVYLPILSTVSVVVYPPIFQAGPRKIAVFFAKALLGLGWPFGIAATVSLVVSRFRRPRLDSLAKTVKLQDLGLAIGLLSSPVILNVMMARNHGAFFERYAITCAVLIAVLAVLLLGEVFAFSAPSGISLITVFVTCGLWINVYGPATGARQQSPRIDTVEPTLDFVVSSGTSFLEIDHYEGSTFLRRVYYLTDHDAAIRFAHATNFEGAGLLKQYFPIRANVSPYQEFVRQHSHFLVLGDISFAEEWLLRKLQYDGAKLTPLSGSLMKYNGAVLYDVQLR